MWIYFSPSTCLWILLVRSTGNIRVLKDYKQIWSVPQAIPLELIMLPCKVYNLQEAGLLRRQASLWRVFHTSYNRQLRHFQVFLSSIQRNPVSNIYTESPLISCVYQLFFKWSKVQTWINFHYCDQVLENNSIQICQYRKNCSVALRLA